MGAIIVDQLAFLEFFDDEKIIEPYSHYILNQGKLRIVLTFIWIEGSAGITLSHEEIDSWLFDVLIDNISRFEFIRNSTHYYLNIYQEGINEPSLILQRFPHPSVQSFLRDPLQYATDKTDDKQVI